MKFEWPLMLPMVQNIMNNTVHSALGVEPSRLIFGDRVTPMRGVMEPLLKKGPTAPKRRRDVALPRDADGKIIQPTTVEDYLFQLYAEQTRITEAARAHQRKEVEARVEARKKYNKKNAGKPGGTEMTKFEEGEYVLVDHPNAPVKNKLSTPWFGPLQVLSVAEEETGMYLCQDMVSLKSNRYHYTRLCKYDPTASKPDVVARKDYQESIPRVSTRKRRASKKAREAAGDA